MLHSIRLKVLLLFMGLTVAACAVVGIFAVHRALQSDRERAFALLAETSNSRLAQVRNWCEVLTRDLAFLESDMAHECALPSHNAFHADMLITQAQTMLGVARRFHDQTGRFDEIALLDAQGVTVISTLPESRGVYRGLHDYFATSLLGPSLHIQTLSYSSVSEGVNNLVVARPLRDAGGAVAAVLMGRASLGPINTILSQQAGLGDSGEVFLVGENHVLLTAIRSGGHSPGQAFLDSPAIQAALRDKGAGVLEYVNHAGQRTLGAYTWLDSPRGILLAEMSRDEVFANAYANGRLITMAALAVAMVSVLVTHLASSAILSPLAVLARRATGIADGRRSLDEPLPHAARRDEIGAMARAFQAMTGKLHQTILELKEEIRIRRDTEAALHRAHSHLEQQVALRTRELTEVNRKLLEYNRQQAAFLSSASHELRTPLTSVLGFAKMIQRYFDRHFLPLTAADGTHPELADRARLIEVNLEIIHQEGERLTRLLNDLLDLNKIESGQMQWRDTTVDVAREVKEAAVAMEGALAGKPAVQLLFDLAADLPALCVDRDRFRQVLINLLGNAVKFTQRGHIRLRAMQTTTILGPAVRIQVEDTGPGIPQEDCQRIFERFYQSQGQDLDRDKPQGTGLGLSICKNIVEHYGGRVWVESALGQGSTFVLEFPLQSSCTLPPRIS